MDSNAIVTSVRSTAAALVGQVGGLFGETSSVHDAVLEIDSDASVPRASALRPGTRHQAKVRLGPSEAQHGTRTVCIKLPDAYGPGRDQDFLLAASGDGAPMHHVVLPGEPNGAALYSSLWLYLVGLTPILFGVRIDDGGLRSGAVAAFCISAPVGKFRRIGSLTIGDSDTSESISFAAGNSGGNIRPLPPVSFY